MNLSLAPLDWIVLFVVMAGSLGYGMYMAYRKKSGQNSSNYFLGGRSIKWPIVGASLFATNIGAEHLVGLSGNFDFDDNPDSCLAEMISDKMLL